MPDVSKLDRIALDDINKVDLSICKMIMDGAIEVEPITTSIH